MSGLKLGDLILDPRRVVYIPSLRVVACADLHDGLCVGIAGGLRGVIERLDATLNEYKPDHLIILGSLGSKSSSSASYESTLAGMARRWGKRARIQLVAAMPDVDARGVAEALGCEVHHELVWGRYRFVEHEEADQALELKLTTIAGGPHYSVRVGNRPFGGTKLAVFLKGLGKLTLPSVNPAASSTTVFKSGLERYDVFAVGHQRILPMGKVGDLKSFKGIGRGLPISKATLSSRRQAPTRPSAG